MDDQSLLSSNYTNISNKITAQTEDISEYIFFLISGP